MSADTRGLEARLAAIEAPRLAEERARELARLQGEAAKAQQRLAEIADELKTLAARRRELAPKIAEASGALRALDAADAELAVAELKLQSEHGRCWQAINAAEIAGRPVPVVVPPHKWAGDAFQRALHKIFGLSLMPKRKPAPVKAGPALRPGEVEGVRVRFTANTTAGGVSRLAGEEGIVTVADADVLVRADKVTVLQTGVVVPPEKPFAIRNVGPVPVAVDGVPLAPGEVAMVSAETWAGVLGGACPALAPADGGVQRMLDLQRRVAELGAE